MSGASTRALRRARYAGDAAVVGPTLCRASIGVENVEDLWVDLDTTLHAALA